MRQLLGVDKGRVGLDRVVEMAHRHLGLDAAFVAEVAGDRLVYRAVAGDGASFNINVNDGPPIRTTYCYRLLAGEIPNVIRDTATAPAVAKLPMTREARIGSYIGIPLRLPDGAVYGVFCCVSHTPDHTLDGRELRFMSMLGELILDDLGADRLVEQLRADLERLIESQRVEVAYQPIFDLRTNRCVGLEALARFPKRFPGTHETLRAARELGLNFELERLLISRAWDAVERIGPDQFLALNVTPGVLLELARRANERDDRDALPLSRLVVEITEHAAIDSYSALLEQLAPLRELGLRIAVDDAGAGYASLRHVLELRPDFIKLDRSLCNGIAADHARRVAASGLVMLARDLGAQVIAEGIECDEDLTAVRELGLDAAQGFLIGEPSSDRDAIDGWTLSPA